ncbi:MAG: murein biosynthesis integral membrane protein MurJ [Lentisphaeraceae bacterium]|nr:murein biosynthesis integral membrane protein MurJ [Lentisphaeraceae bacterium]
MKEKKSDTLSSSAIKTGLGNLISRLSGLFRDILFAACFGVDGAISNFFVALTIPNLSRRIFGEGALTAAFIPLLSEKFDDKEDSWKFISIVLSITTCLTTAITLIGVIICSLAALFTDKSLSQVLEFSSFLLPYMIFICLSALMSAILNLMKSFTLSAFSSVLFNICLIIAATAAISLPGSNEQKIYWLITAVLISGILQCILLFCALKRRGLKLNWMPNFKSAEWHSIKKLFIPGVFGASVAQLSVLSDRLIATSIGEHAVSALYYSERLTYFPVGIFGVALGVACLPYMSRASKNNDQEGLMRAFSFSIRQVCFLTVPCTFLFFLYHEEILRLIFMRGKFDETSLQLSALGLLYYLPGIPAFAGIKVILPLYYARKDTSTPVKIAIRCLIFNVIMGISFIPLLSHGSLALATTAACYLNIFLLLRCSKQKNIGTTLRNLLIPVCRTSLCALLACAIIYMLPWPAEGKTISHSWLILTAQLCLSLIVYIFIHFTFRGEELKELLNRQKRQ